MKFPPRIVVAMADDPYLFWFLAFVESFRIHNPDLPLYVIPYSDRIDAIDKLRDPYGFEFLDLPESETIRAAAEDVHGALPQTALYRRFAAHALPVDEFLYLDSDCLVLADLAPFFGHTGDTLDLAYGTANPDRVYRPDAVARFPDSHLFNTGMYLSSPSRIPFADLLDCLVVNGALLREVECGFVYDQTFLNLFADLSGIAVADLYGLQDDWAPMVWSDYPELTRANGGFRESAGGRPVAVVHWAGHKAVPGGRRNMEAILDFHTRGRARLRAAGVDLPGRPADGIVP